MKKIALFFVLVSISVMSFAQLTVGGHFAYNSTWLMNKQVFDEGAEMDVAASFGNYVGLIGGYYFTDNFGVEIDFNSNKIEQKYEGSIKYLVGDERNDYNSSLVLRTLDVPVLLKFGKVSYFEFGPVIQLVNKATYTRTFVDESSDGLPIGWYNDRLYTFNNLTNKGVKADFNGTGFGVAMGFGANFNLMNDQLFLNFGVRFNYILTDLKGVNGLGENINSAYVSDIEETHFFTNPLYGGLKLGIIYMFE